MPFGLLRLLLEQDNRDTQAQAHVQQSDLLASVPLLSHPGNHALLFPQGQSGQELGQYRRLSHSIELINTISTGSALIHFQGPGPSQVSVAADPLRNGRSPILQLDTTVTLANQSIIASRSSQGTRVLELQVLQNETGELMPTDLEVHPLYHLTPQHTQNSRHADFAFDHSSNNRTDRALVLNTAGALFQFSAGLENATSRSVHASIFSKTEVNHFFSQAIIITRQAVHAAHNQTWTFPRQNLISQGPSRAGSRSITGPCAYLGWQSALCDDFDDLSYAELPFRLDQTAARTSTAQTSVCSTRIVYRTCARHRKAHTSPS